MVIALDGFFFDGELITGNDIDLTGDPVDLKLEDIGICADVHLLCVFGVITAVRIFVSADDIIAADADTASERDDCEYD